MHMKVKEFEMNRFMVLGRDGRKCTLCGLQMNLRFIILNQLGFEDPTEWKI